MLAERFANERLEAALIPQERFRPYPPVDAREAWERLPERLRAAQTALGEKHLDQAWPPLPARVFMEFERKGDREGYQELSFARRTALANLVVAECMEDRGRFVDTVIDGVWAICEESFWGVPAHKYMAKRSHEPLPDVTEPVVDLFAAETAALLAWTHYLLGSRLDAVSRLLRERIEYEVKRRVLDPFLQRDDIWWMGLATQRRMNNWNPWCTSNCLTALLLLERDPARRRAGVAKSLRILDRFLGSYGPDGGCDEGSTYWGRAGGSLFDCLELLHGATGGWIDVYGEPLIGEIGRYMVRAYIGGDYFINFADGSAKLPVYDGHSGFSPALVYSYGRRIGDADLQALAVLRHRQRRERALHHDSPLLRRLPSLFLYEELERAAAGAHPGNPFLRDVWLPDTQVMVARERTGTDRGLYVAAKGGHNAESHNHNDVGNFILYCDGAPVIVDVGVETYTKWTFSSRRYEIWTMRSEYHNVPTVGGVEQRAGAEFRAAGVIYRASDEAAELSLDLGGAYPPDAGIAAWRRTVRLRRGPEAWVDVTDAFRLDKEATVAWNLMTAAEPRFDDAGSGVILGGARPVRVDFEADGFTARWTCERIDVTDPWLTRVWGSALFRLRLCTDGPVGAGTCRLCFAAGAPT